MRITIFTKRDGSCVVQCTRREHDPVEFKEMSERESLAYVSSLIESVHGESISLVKIDQGEQS
jgi:hypothetical protein